MYNIIYIYICIIYVYNILFIKLYIYVIYFIYQYCEQSYLWQIYLNYWQLFICETFYSSTKNKEFYEFYI